MKDTEDIDIPDVPLAAMMRPRTLDDFLGQRHLIGKNKILRRAIELDRFTSIIFYGVAGIGKTSLAEIIALRTNSRFVRLSAVTCNVSELRKEIQKAKDFSRIGDKPTIIFIDEIHRFNKSQQDILLPFLEQGEIRFIGATTQNPNFYLNHPLISRSQIFHLASLDEKDLITLIDRSINNKIKGLPSYGYKVIISHEAKKFLAKISDGDARKCLNILELASVTTPKNKNEETILDLEDIQNASQKKIINYDNTGDEHYDTISAFIKSIRGSDPDASLYWLAKMIYGGEDPRFIVRRLIISASEDIGLADSNALRVCTSALQAIEFIGMPEARITLAHATVYLATAPKSNRAYAGLESAIDDVKNKKTLDVPLHLRTKSRKKLAESLGNETKDFDYKYSHDYENSIVKQPYLSNFSDTKSKKKYYTPTENGQEKRIKERLVYWESLLRKK